MNNEVLWKATGIDGFIAASVRFISSGYWFIYRGRVPDHKDAETVVKRLIREYDIPTVTWKLKTRSLGSKSGIRILSHGQVFVVFMTSKQHAFCRNRRPGDVIDTRRKALRVFGYRIKYSQPGGRGEWKVCVRLDEETYRTVKNNLLTICTWNSFGNQARMEREFHALPYQPYEFVYDQLLAILKEVNRARRRRGFDQLDATCIRKFRRITKFYERPQS